MLKYVVKPLTLRDFYELHAENFGDLLDPLVFAQNYRSAWWCALLALRVFSFPDGAPTKNQFLESIKGADLERLRDDLFNAYRDFFPTRVQRALDAWIEKTREIRAQAQENANGLEPTSGEIEPSN